MRTATMKKAICIMLSLIVAATISCSETKPTNNELLTGTNNTEIQTQDTQTPPQEEATKELEPTPQLEPTAQSKAITTADRDTSNGNRTITAAESKTEPTPTLEDILEKGFRNAGASPVQLVLRGTPQTDSVRCEWRGIARTPGQREEALQIWLDLDDSDEIPHPEYLEILFKATSEAIQPKYAEILKSNLNALARGGLSEDYLFLTCFTDYAVSEYILGNGPMTLTLARDHMGEAPSYSLYVRGHEANDYGDETLRSKTDHLALMEDIANSAKTELGKIAANGEAVVFLAPMGAHHAIAFETWQIVAEWTVQDNGDGTSTVTKYNTGTHDPEYQQSLDNLKSRVTTAAANDDFADARITSGAGLTQYYRDIGAYDDITPGDGSDATFMPAMPPPAPTCAGSTAVGTDPDQGLVQDCDTLLTAMNTLAGTATLNWSKDIAISAWNGIRTGGNPKRVHHILLTDQDLNGSIPATLGNLSELRRIELDENALTGPIPPQLGNLKKLTHLYIFENELTGEIPPELGQMTSLQVLYPEDNALTGQVPQEIGNLSNLTQLVLADNQLSGPLPDSLGQLTNLGHLRLRDNQFTGQIPRSLSSLNIQYLGLSGNAFTGCLPTGLDTGGNDDLWRPEIQALPSCAPTFAQESYAFTVARTATADTTVGAVTATPFEASDQLTHTITDGNTDQLFSLDPSTGVITINETPSQDAEAQYTLTLKAQDSHGQTSTVQVQVTLNS